MKKRKLQEVTEVKKEKADFVKKAKGMPKGAKVTTKHAYFKNYHERILVKITCLNESSKLTLKRLNEKSSNIVIDEGDMDYLAETIE